MANNSKIAWKAKAQLGDFSVKVFHDFSKPERKFIAETIFGIQATGNTVLTDIARTLAPDGGARNAENRISRNLMREGLSTRIEKAVLRDAGRRIRDDTLVIVDPTDVCKPHALKMEHLTMVRDASRSSKDSVVTARGYHGCMAVACHPGSRKTIPLSLRTWSSNAPGYRGENDEVLNIIRAVDDATDGRGIRVYDRGGDRPCLYDHYLDNGHRFITRMNERNLVSWKAERPNSWLASQCVMSHSAVVRYDSHGRERPHKIDFGVMPVRLPWRKEELRLVVIRGFGHKPMMLLTNLAVDERLEAEGRDGTLRTYEALWQVVEGYLSRWRIEETIRFVKQCYGFENIRVLRYERWKNMTALLLAAAYFAAVWLGRDVRKDVLVDHIEHMHQRFNEVPDFFLYALAAGIRRAFARYGRWTPPPTRKEKPDPQPDLPGWDDIPYLGVG